MTKFKPTEGSKPEKQVTISFTATPEYIRKVDKIVNQNNLSRSRFVKQCVDFAMSQMEEGE